MSYGSSHTLYNFGFPSVELVFTTDVVQVDNRPMNQKKITVHKGVTNKINFTVRNRDRQLVDVSSSIVMASLVSADTGRRIFQKIMDVQGLPTGQAQLTLVPSDISALQVGLYNLSITYSDDDGATEFPLYSNQNDHIMIDLDIRSTLEFDPAPTQETTTFTQVSDPQGDYYVSDPFNGNQDQNQTHCLHTIAFYMDQFVGEVTVQGSIQESVPDPENDTDWFDINVQGDIGSPEIPFNTAFTGVDPFNFTVNALWIRVKYTVTSGSITRIQLRN